MDARHEQIARVALAAGARYGLALAGGYAVSAHGMGNRPSGDVDLFTSWQHRGEFPELTAAVTTALEAAGYKATVIMIAETFTRLLLTDPTGGSEEKLELSVDWRAHDPVQLAVGPVLHADDAVANKVCALFGRALPRDFLDVDAVISSGRYTREQLLELAAEADRGFDRLLFADALGALTQITDAAFDEYRRTRIRPSRVYPSTTPRALAPTAGQASGRTGASATSARSTNPRPPDSTSLTRRP